MKLLIILLAAGALFSTQISAQSGPASASARAGIDAGNQAWIDGVKTGNIDMILATYTEDAVDCGPSRECFKGKLQIEKHMKAQLASLGRARTAAVTTWGSTQQGRFAYK
jgi:ketosteroid isomerase-like protein